ncbi:hypothetical protein [Cohnella sp. WQ 127256]|uniref:hypothetical protein n=1 Tax=Cohnella sp. WQ 127256 TaxID=2938790 RepID=UPI0021186F62|nr:hypothetical protein [Cohnella sp. WQ 127256]
MDITFSANNFEEVRRLPIIPSSIDGVATPWGNEEFETIGQGTLNLIGLKGLRTMTIDSFFPMREYSFAKDKRMGNEYVDFFNKWRAKRVPLRLIITINDSKEWLNMACTIENFTYGLDRSGDIPYSLEIKEFRFVKVK